MINWLIFEGEQIWHSSLRKIPNSGLINYSSLNLIKLCLSCAKQNAKVKTASGICSMFRVHLLLTLLTSYYEPFFSLKYLFPFFVPVVDWLHLFTRVTSWKCNRSNMNFSTSCETYGTFFCFVESF